MIHIPDWFIKLFETESILGFDQGRPQDVSVTGYDLTLLQTFAQQHGGQVNQYSSPNRPANWAPLWEWRQEGHAAIPLLETLLPHLSPNRAARVSQYLDLLQNRPATELSPEATVTEILNLRKQGLSAAKIGARLRLDHFYVDRVIRKNKT